MDGVRCFLFLSFFAFTVSVVFTDPQTLPSRDNGNIPSRLSVFSSFDEVTSFIHRWFASLKNRFINGGESKTDEQEARTNRQTRELHVPTGFEAYELYFLRTAVVQDLQTFFSFAKELQKNNTEARSRLDDIWRHEEQRVKSMTEAELKQYSQALRTALQTGISSSQTLSVNGKVYDMNHVASWCCPF